MTFNELWNEILSEMPRKQRIRIRILSFVEYCKVHLLHLARKIERRCGMNNEMTTEYMSNEEVIEVLKGIVFNGFDRTTRKERQALDIAIKALQEVNSV